MQLRGLSSPGVLLHRIYHQPQERSGPAHRCFLPPDSESSSGVVSLAAAQDIFVVFPKYEAVIKYSTENKGQ